MAQNEIVTLPRAQRDLAPQTYSFAEIERLADYIAKSRLFGLTTREQAIVMMSIAQSEGRHPAQAAKDYNIIQGRPSKTAEAMQRDFMHAGGRIEWHELSDDIAAATFTHPQGGSVRIVWDTRRAVQAALAGKEMWKKYPRQMLRSRCVSEGVKTIYPAATSGFYTPEEVRDMPALDALPQAASDTTADLDSFAAAAGDMEPVPERDLLAEAREIASQGTMPFRQFWADLSVSERGSIRQHIAEFAKAAATADDPFGLPPMEAAAVVPEAPPVVIPARHPVETTPIPEPVKAPETPPRSAIWNDESYRIEPGTLLTGEADWAGWRDNITWLIGEATAAEIDKLKGDNREYTNMLRASSKLEYKTAYRAVMDAAAARLKELGGDDAA